MNRHHKPFVALAFVCASLALNALGQTQPPPAPPGESIQTAVAISSQQMEAIRAFIAGQVAILKGGTPGEQMAARDALVASAMLKGQSASPAYTDAYASELNSAMLSMVSHPNLGSRLRAAIVLAKVSESTQSARLLPATLAFMKDKSDPVALWGLKSARTIVPTVFSNPLLPSRELAQTIVDLAQGRSLGNITYEAYNALAAAESSLVVPQMITLLQRRVDQYAQHIPDDPLAENRAVAFLSESNIWSAMTPDQKTRTVQQLYNLVVQCSRRTDSPSKADRQAMISVVHQSASAGIVIGEIIKDDALVAGFSSLKKVNGVSHDQTVMLAEALLPIIQANPLFTGKVTATPAVKAQ